MGWGARPGALSERNSSTAPSRFRSAGGAEAGVLEAGRSGVGVRGCAECSCALCALRRPPLRGEVYLMTVLRLRVIFPLTNKCTRDTLTFFSLAISLWLTPCVNARVDHRSSSFHTGRPSRSRPWRASRRRARHVSARRRRRTQWNCHRARTRRGLTTCRGGMAPKWLH